MNRAERRALAKDPERQFHHELADGVCNDFMTAVLGRIKAKNEITKEEYLELWEHYNEEWKNICLICEDTTKFKEDWFEAIFKGIFLHIRQQGYIEDIDEQIDKVFDIYLNSKKPQKPFRNQDRIRMSKKERRKKRQEAKKNPVANPENNKDGEKK